jgi:hypothetical protein
VGEAKKAYRFARAARDELRHGARRFPYTIAYRIVADHVVILAVAHHRLEPGVWEDR